MIGGLRKLQQVADDLKGISFSAGAASAEGTRSVYADLHICRAVPLFYETVIACILVLW
jgi:hypothetical protein